MSALGIIEGFYGPEWSWASRHQICESLRTHGGDFYLYAPKRDSFLRKNWMQNHPAELWNELKSLSSKCQQSGVAFGIGLSPFELHSHWDDGMKKVIQDKIHHLEELNIQYLGLFFDDMKGMPDLAQKQAEILDFVQNVTRTILLFCPTYYSPDPILDKVFGERPAGYLEEIGQSLDPKIQILWTGNKVIPSVITGNELDEVAQVLKRKPFLWDNYFANDGPKQCKFLKMKPLEGRDQQTLKSAAGWAFNLMNQPNLSEILFASSVDVLKNGEVANRALDQAVQRLAGSQFAEVLQKYRNSFLEVGYDKLELQQKEEIRHALGADRFSEDVLDWLDGKYLVGSECLTD